MIASRAAAPGQRFQHGERPAALPGPSAAPSQCPEVCRRHRRLCRCCKALVVFLCFLCWFHVVLRVMETIQAEFWQLFVRHLFMAISCAVTAYRSTHMWQLVAVYVLVLQA